MNENMNMKLEKSPNDVAPESIDNQNQNENQNEKKFQQELAAVLVDKWPELRNEIDEFNRDTFYNKAINALHGADADIQGQFVEDMKVVKYEDMEELFENYVQFMRNRRSREMEKESIPTTTTNDAVVEERQEKAA